MKCLFAGNVTTLIAAAIITFSVFLASKAVGQNSQLSNRTKKRTIRDTSRIIKENSISYEEKSVGDIEFENLNLLMEELKKNDYLFLSKDSGDNVEYAKMEEKNLKLFREIGLQLWDQFPNDHRRFDWLGATMGLGYALHYWGNLDEGVRSAGAGYIATSYTVKLDTVALKTWERRYPILRKEFIEHFTQQYHNKTTKNSVILKRLNAGLLMDELKQFLALSLNTAYRGSKLDIERLENQVSAIMKILYYDDTSTWKSLKGLWKKMRMILDNDFIARYAQLGLDADDVSSFIHSFQRDSNPLMREWSKQRSTLFSLKERPMEFMAMDINGKWVDLRKMRGKVVLIDFWGTWCSNCIARMPAIKEAHERFREQGFEVISACLNMKSDTTAVQKIIDKVDAKWPTVIIGRRDTNDKNKSLASNIFSKYGFAGVPQLLLLNKKGEMVMLNDLLRDGDFAPLVEKLLQE